MNDILTLVKINVQEAFNLFFRFGRIGIITIVLEVFTFISIIYLYRFYPIEESFYSILSLWGCIILVSNAHVNAKKILFSPSNLRGYVSAVPSQKIVFSNILYLAMQNLRFWVLLPFLLMALNGYWYPLILCPLFFLGTAIIVTVLTILARSISIVLDMVTYFIFLILLPLGLILCIMGILGYGIKIQAPILFLLAVFSIAAILICFLGRERLMKQWESSLLKAFNKVSRKKVTCIFEPLYSLCKNPLLAKEWTITLRNPLSLLRPGLYILFLTICLLSPIKNYLSTENAALGASLLLWVFCFSEMLVTNWQNEKEKKCLYWLGNVNAIKVLYAKFLSYLPIALFGCIVTLVLTLTLSFSFAAACRILLYFLCIILATIILSLAITSILPGKNMSEANDYILEQVPQSLGAMVSLGLQFFIVICSFIAPLLTVIITVSLVFIAILIITLRK